VKICTIDGCGNKHHGKGFCRRHYNYEYKKERIEYRLDNREKIVERKAKYYQNHKIERLEYERNRRIDDIQYRLSTVMRTRMNKAIKGIVKAGSAVRDLGCSLGQFRLFIENQFESGMSWDNYGKWHLDHVQPLASFDLTDRSQFLTACNWLNYQPLWAGDNIRKGAR